MSLNRSILADADAPDDSPISGNEIVRENALRKGVVSFWELVWHKKSDVVDGFAAAMSVNKGDTIQFKLRSTRAFRFNIFRLGYYGGAGARLVASLGEFGPQEQPAVGPNNDIERLVDCGIWKVTATWAVPIDTVSGVFLAHMSADDGHSNYILFIVRDDAAATDLLFKTSDPTWQAYNRFRDLCFYPSAMPEQENKHYKAAKVSYNRPMEQDYKNNAQEGSDNFFLSSEFRMVRWLERNGYKVKYVSAVDVAKATAASPAFPTILGDSPERPKIKVLLSVGHDEYWSREERDCFEVARDNGIHLCFFSGNECYWKTRWENEFRTLVCYKDGTDGENASGGKLDPVMWTGLWRNPESAKYEAGVTPESLLSGQLSWVVTPSDSVSWTINVPKKGRDKDKEFANFWRYTDIAEAQENEIVTLQPGTHLGGLLGYEWDFEHEDMSLYPQERTVLSEVAVYHPKYNKIYTHKLSICTYPGKRSAVKIFGAGTTRWSWGLDNLNTGDTPLDGKSVDSNPTDRNVQQATANLLFDMGAQPTTLQSNLVWPTPLVPL